MFNPTTGYLVRPDGIVALEVAPGTWLLDQLPAVAQPVLMLPVHVGALAAATARLPSAVNPLTCIEVDNGEVTVGNDHAEEA